MKLYDEQTDQAVDFFIPEQYKKIAVNCSGGADSSILLYATIKFLEENNRSDTKVSVLTCVNDFKGRWNSIKATSVIDYVINKTGTTLIDNHFSYYRDNQDVKYFHEVEFDLFSNKKVDLIVSGLTSNPVGNTLVSDIKGNVVDLKTDALPKRDGKNHTEWNLKDEAAWYQPFVNIDKKFIAHLYRYYDVDDLLDFTRSCEAFADTTENFTKPCGTCWWCLERKWAFGRF